MLALAWLARALLLGLCLCLDQHFADDAEHGGVRIVLREASLELSQ